MGLDLDEADTFVCHNAFPLEEPEVSNASVLRSQEGTLAQSHPCPLLGRGIQADP